MTTTAQESVRNCECGTAWSLPMDQHVPGIQQRHAPVDGPEESRWRPLTLRERWRIFAPVHETWFLLHFVGMRDRLRCPSCKAVGTWKPHGSLTERLFVNKDIAVRRWLCKWCGHYNGPRGRVVAYLDMAKGYWTIPQPGEPRQPTPAEVLADGLPKAWPWLG